MFLFKPKQKSRPVEWLIAGLGNPGSEYEATRHNTGFICVDFLAEKYNIKINRLKFSGVYGTGEINGTGVCLLKPQTYMNKSGESVREAMKWFKLTNERIIIIYDDASMQPGKVRFRDRGSDGGQKGARDIIYRLNTDVFPRLKIGIGAPPHPDYEMTDWVLGRFSGDEMKVIQEAVRRIPDEVELIIKN